MLSRGRVSMISEEEEEAVRVRRKRQAICSPLPDAQAKKKNSAPRLAFLSIMGPQIPSWTARSSSRFSRFSSQKGPGRGSPPAIEHETRVFTRRGSSAINIEVVAVGNRALLQRLHHFSLLISPSGQKRRQSCYRSNEKGSVFGSHSVHALVPSLLLFF